MLQIYAYKPANIIDNNDLLFERGSYAKIVNEPIEGTLHATIARIEQVSFVSRDRIVSKITEQPISLTEISTGCKVVINIILNPNIPVNVYECGENYIHEIYRLDKGKIYSPEYIWPKNDSGLKDVEFEGIISDHEQIRIHGLDELKRWYSANVKN